MPIARQSLSLNIRPFLEHNLQIAGRASHAIYAGTADLHARAARTVIARRLDHALEHRADVREQCGLRGMLLARNLASVVTVPLDFAFGTGRWQAQAQPSANPYDFARETLAHPCSLGVSGALLTATTTLWSVFAAAVSAVGCAQLATFRALAPWSRYSWATHYAAAEQDMLRRDPVTYTMASLLPLLIFRRDGIVGGVPVVGALARTSLVRELPWVAPLTLFAPTMSMLVGRALTAALKFAVSGVGYALGYAAGFAYAQAHAGPSQP